MNFFWPHHLKYLGTVDDILTVENFTFHDMKQFCSPTCIGIKLMSPKVTCRHQPADMGIISSLKVGYKSLCIRKLLEIFDTPGVFERAAVVRKVQRRGCRVR